MLASRIRTPLVVVGAAVAIALVEAVGLVSRNALEGRSFPWGLALRTGKFNDLGKFKVPQLRGLGNRAPYFHNGAAATLNDVLRFYNQRFNIGFTAEEMRLVVLFLQQT